MKNVVIIGNSGAARECHSLLRDEMTALGDGDVAFKGFLAFEGYKGNLRELKSFALGSDDDYALAPDDVLVIGIGMPALRLKAFHKWKARGATFFNLVHPQVKIAENAVIGEGNILTHGVWLSCDVALGDVNYLNGSVVAGHDVRIGHGNFFGTFTQLLGDAHIGDGNSFGVNCVVMPGAKIGDNNTFAPGTYVYKGCGDGRRMAGNPALDVS